MATQEGAEIAPPGLIDQHLICGSLL